MQILKPKIATPGEPTARPRDYRIGLIASVLALVTFAIYSRVVGFDFVNFDDFAYVSQNPFVNQGLTSASVKWAFTAAHSSNWHPLTWLSHMLDCQIYGLNHPGGHHLTNLVFHIANVLLLFAVWRRLTGTLWRSALVAALFAWHPLHVESVAWIAERKDVLSTFFFLLTLLAYARFVAGTRDGHHPARKWYWLSLVLYICGLMSKPMIVTLPFVLLLLDFWPLQRWSFPTSRPGSTHSPDHGESLLYLVIEKIPFFLLSLAASVTTFLVQKSGNSVDAHTTFSLKLENAIMGYKWYFQKTFWPSNLAVFYPLPSSIPLGSVLLAGAFLMAVTGLALWQMKERPWFPVGWFWFLGMLVPVCGLVHVGSQATADRYGYMPQTGLFVIGAWGWAELSRHFARFKPGLAAVIAVPLLGLCIGSSFRQVGYWKNSETLFRRDLAVTTDNPLGHVNLGAALDEAGQPEAAKAEFIAAAADSNSPNTLVSVGGHYARQGDDTNAIKFYHQAIRESPFYADAHYNLGNVLARQGRLEAAAAEYEEALKIKPDTADARNNLGAVLMRLGRYQESLTQFQIALRLQPNYPEAEDQIGHVLMKLGREPEALPHFQTATELAPTLVDAQLQVGLLLASEGRLLPALAPLQAVVRLDPHNLQGWFNLGNLYQALQQYDRAEEAFTEVLRLNPKDAESAAALAAMFARQGKFAEAVPAYRRALTLDANSLRSLQGLAWILATSSNPELRNGAEAVQLARRAAELTGRQQPMILTALDAALAESGRFEEAIQTARETETLARSLKQNEIADQALARLELYKSGKPFHQ